jgi:CRP-like cAMP-binding protein
MAVWEAAPEAAGDRGPAIPALLGDDDPWLRACAAFAAATLGDAEVVRLREGLARTDRDPLVREAAAMAGMKEGEDDVETLSTLSTMERILFLRKVRLVADLSPEDLKQVAEICSEQLFPDGAVIAEQGEAGEELHIVVSGEIRVVVAGDGGPHEEIARRGAGEYVGEMAILSREPRMASLVASGDVRTLSIDRKRFERILRDRPDASLAVIRVLCDRLTESHAPGARGARV